MRPSFTATSIPQSIEQRTHADWTQRTSAASTPSARNRSTRTGQLSPCAYGVRVPQMSAIRSLTRRRVPRSCAAKRSAIRRPEALAGVDKWGIVV
jgi:hypothetical protein